MEMLCTALVAVSFVVSLAYVIFLMTRKKGAAFVQRHLLWAALICFVGYYGANMVGMMLFQGANIKKALLFTAGFVEVVPYSRFLLIAVAVCIIGILTCPLLLRKQENVIVVKNTGLKAAFTRFGRKHVVFSFWLSYSALFCGIAVLYFSTLLLSNRTLIWKVDGMPQYVPYLRYTGQYLREFVRNLLDGRIFIKMFDFNIGMGEDITTAFRTHLSEMISVLVPVKYTEQLYNFLMVFRLYLAGLSFAAFCRYHKKPWMGTLLGSLLYVFSSYTVRFVIRHPVFCAPIILLPLLLITLDRLIKDRKILWYSLIVAVSLFTNYFFLYINTFAMGVYALIRFFEIYKENRVKEFFKMMGRIIFSYLLGCGLAMAVFLPTLIRTMSSERVGSGAARITIDSIWTYGPKRPIEAFLSLITSEFSAGYTSYYSIAAIILPALIVVFICSIKKRVGLKLALILQIVMILVPFAGFVMSGFSNINNRWTYVFVFTMCYAFVDVVDDLRNLHIIQLVAIIAVAAGYWALKESFKPDNFDIKISFAILVTTIVLLVLVNVTKGATRFQYAAVLLVCIIPSLFVHGRHMFDSKDGKYTDEFMYQGSISNKFENSRFNNFAKIKDDDFYRCDTNLTWDMYENAPIVLKYNGTSMYNSVLNSAVINYHREIGSIGISAVHRYYCLDGRTALEALANTKYYMTETGKKQYVPYGFELMEGAGDSEYDIYRNTLTLPIAYTYDSYVDRADYDTFDPLAKQETQLRAVVLDTTKGDIQTDNVRRIINCPAQGIITEKAQLISKEKDVYLQDDGSLQIGKKEEDVSKEEKEERELEGKLTYKYKKKAGYEAYLSVGKFVTDKARAVVNVSTSDINKVILGRADNEVYSLKRDFYLVNLGYSDEDKEDTVSLDFVSAGDYTLQDISICYVPMKDYEQEIKARSQEALENVKVDTNTVSGTVKLTGDKLMVFSIPYSNGWKIYVDGEEGQLFKANTMYMGTALAAGSHDIVLKYTTPGFKLGVYISIASAGIFLLILVVSGISKLAGRRKKQQPNG